MRKCFLEVKKLFDFEVCCDTEPEQSLKFKLALLSFAALLGSKIYVSLSIDANQLIRISYSR